MHELEDERAVVRRAVEGLHLTPILFELGARPHPPRELYRAYLDQSDIFVGIYGEQYGWVAPGSTISGIEDEYDLSVDKPRLIYVRALASGRDPQLEVLLDRISNDGVSFRIYHEAAELFRVISDDLAVLMSERFFAHAGDTMPEVTLRSHDLPAPPTRFVGRRQELHEVQALISDPGTRLLTLTGPGGIGKTRLALAVAEATKEGFEDGAAGVLLAPVRSADLVPTKIATSLGIPVTAARSAIEVVKDYLRERELLLLMDNFEHVVLAAPVLVDLLKDCRRIKIIVTSREMLRVSAEHVYAVPPLELSPGANGRADAVELFLDRALAIHHDLDVTDDLLGATSEICRRLDGLPLAIELAAARTRILTPQDILSRLDRRLQLLTTGPSDVPERQRTLRATIEWSYDLLNEHEQQLFDQLGVFRGGFTLEAAEGVVTDSPDLLEGLASLMDKSLIRTDDTVIEPRFMMLETLREFALERLRERADLETVRRKHAEYFTDWVVTIDTDGREAEAVRQMKLDNDNVRASFAWLLQNGDPGRVARAAAVVWKFWWVRSLFLEGIDWMEQVKARPEPLSPHEDATVEFTIGMLAFGHGNYPRAVEALTHARAGYEGLGDVRGAALTWICLGVAMSVGGDPEGEALLRRAVKTLRGSGDDWATAFSLFGLGRVILMDGRAVEAVPLLEKSVEHAVRIGSQTLLAFALVNLGWARIALPDIDGARIAILRALEGGASMDNRDSMARSTEALSAVALSEGALPEAAVLFGAAEAIRRSIGAVVWVPDGLTHTAVETSLRDQLGDEKFEAGFEQGLELSVQGAVDLAFSYDPARVRLDDLSL